MEQLLEVASQFPTIIYSTLLGIVVVYWLVGMLGLFDLDLSGDLDLDLDMDIDSDIEIDTDVSVGGLTGFMLTFGFVGVPFSLVFSILILMGWLISFYLQLYFLDWLPEGWLYYLVGTLSSIIVFMLAIPITSILIRPLKGIFKSAETTLSNNLVGKEAIISTKTISETFGQARLFNEGAEIILDVRCAPEHILKKGDKVLVLQYHKENHIYLVAPY